MLTKSDLQSFLQCPRKLWLEHRRPDLIPTDDPTIYRRATDGDRFSGFSVRLAGSVSDLRKLHNLY